MPKLQDRVQETTTSTGTGSFALNGAVTGYITFNSGFSNGDVVWYVCDSGAGDWEIGYGTVGTGTLTRTVFQSSNSNNLVSFGVGTKRVFCTAPYTYLLPDQTSNSGKILTTDGTTASWTTVASAGGVTSVSVASANGFAGTSSGGSTPALTLSTSISGILKGNGTAISAAVAGTDYAAANASFTLGSTSVSLGGTTTTVAGLTLTNPTINGFTGNTSVINIGSGQFYKDTSGNVGIGTSSPVGKSDVVSNAYAAFVARASTSGVGQSVDALKALDSSASQFANAKYTALSHGWYNQSLVRQLYLDSSGNLGLSITPSASVVKSFEVGDYTGLADGPGGGGGFGLLGNAYEYSNGAYKYRNSYYATLYRSYAGQHQWFTAPSGTAGNAISFTQAMTLDASGNLGIGTTSPSFALDIATALANIRLASSTGTNSCLLRLTNTGGTAYIGLDNSAGGVAASYALTMYHGGAYPIIFSTSGTERARIDSSGNLLVGTTSISSLAGNCFFAAPVAAGGNIGIGHASGVASGQAFMQFFYNASAIGSITQNGTTGVLYNTSSDQRLKENIVDAPSALGSVNAIKVRSFDWKSDGSHIDYGYIAQELVDIAPEAVHTPADPEEMMGVDFGKLTPRLVKAIQELSAELNELKKRIN